MSKKRKYQTEFALNIFSSEPIIVTPADLDKLHLTPDDIRECINNSNIYVILKRPRITFIPDTIRIENSEVCGKVGIQLVTGLETRDFTIRGKLPELVVGARAAAYPHTKLELFDSSGETLQSFPFTYFMPHITADLGEHAQMEVVYVGQAFGSSGERSAAERLKSHSTLQKILADISVNQPNQEVFLALYQFEFHRFVINMDGINKAEVTGKPDNEAMKRKLESKFKRKMRISLAEAALIRYFQPEYNKVYKTEFPQKRHKILKKLYDFDFAALFVEACVEDLGLRIYSEEQASSWHHIAKFELHDEHYRRAFFYGEP